MKILHTADIHLDSKLKTNLDSDEAKKRRNEIIDAFRDMVEYAKNEGAIAILISGDLFDKAASKVSKTAKTLVMDLIVKNPEIIFFYLSGNHDEESFLDEFDKIPDNLEYFGDRWKSYRLGRRIAVVGAELTGENNQTLFHSLVLDNQEINIVMLHGQISEYGTDDKKESIGLADLKNKGIDYLALGHVHSYQLDNLDLRGRYCYPGCLEPRGFDEPGEHGFVMLNINEDSGEIKESFVPFAKRKAHLCHADITGAETTAEATDMIEKIMEAEGVSAGDMVKLYVEGYVDASSEIDYSYIENHFKNRFFAFRFRKKTTIKVDYDSYELDATLKGEFVKTVRNEDNLTEEEKGEIVSLGIALLANPKFFKES